MATVAKQRRTKGEGSIYQRPDGRWYYIVDITVPGGGRKRRTVSAATRKELTPKIRALRKRTEAGTATDGTQTVAAWITYWLDEISDLRESTKKTYRGYITKWIVPHVGKVKLADLTPEHVRSLMSAMEKADRAPATRKQVLSILSKALDVAHREGKVDRNVCDTVVRPSLARQKRHGVLTLDQVKALLPHIYAHDNKARWLAAIILGLRQGEALGLAWADVHLDDPEPWLHVREAQARDLTLDGVKSAASDRVVPIIEPVYTALLEQRERDGADGLVWGPRPNWSDYNEWHRLLDVAGVPRVPVHAARATAASVLDAMGATPRQVADILGQATVHVGQKHYVHSEAGQLRAALTRAGDAITGPVNET